MGTFDSVYKNKIRQLEEENQYLRNIIDEAFAGISRKPFPKLEDLPTPIDGRGRSKIKISQGIDPFAKKPDFDMNNPPEPAPIDGSNLVRERTAARRRANAGGGDGPYMPKPKPKPEQAPIFDTSRRAKREIPDLPHIQNAQPEPAPYPSDDMESRRVQPGYGGAGGPEGIKDQFGRPRDHWRYGEPPLMPKGGFGRPLTPGMGGLYR